MTRPLPLAGAPRPWVAAERRSWLSGRAARSPSVVGDDPGRQDCGRQDCGRQDCGRQDCGRQDCGRQDCGRQDRGFGDRGSALVWLLLLLPVLFAFGGLVLDGGRVITARQNAANIAEQAARQAVDELDQDTFRDTGNAVGAVDLPAAAAAACRYTATAAPGSRCATTLTADGQVRVQVTTTTPTALLAAVGVAELTVTSTGQSRPAVGVTQEVQP